MLPLEHGSIKACHYGGGKNFKTSNKIKIGPKTI
jgi:hypothetical protein